MVDPWSCGLAVALVLVAGAACDGSGQGGSTPGAETGSGGTRPGPGSGASSRPLSPTSGLAQDVWRPVDDLPVRDTPLPRVVDLAKVAEARPVNRAPLGRALMAVGVLIRARHVGGFAAGMVGLVGPGGELRLVDLSAAGVRQGNNIEQPFELSPDGRLLALGDRRGIVIVDVGTGRSRRFVVGAKSPVALHWMPDGQELLFMNRHTADTGWRLPLATGEAVQTPYSPLSTCPRAPGEVLSFNGPYQTPVREVVWWTHDEPERNVTLASPVQFSGPVVCRGNIAGYDSPFRQVDGHPALRGLAVLDSASGEFVSALPLPTRAARRTTVNGWDTTGGLLFTTAPGRTGGVLRWSRQDEELSVLTRIPTRGTIVSLATDLL